MAKRVLIVDDEPGILLAFKKLLQTTNRIVDTAQTIEEAERSLKETAYDVVIADLRLTGVLGEEGLEIIRYIHDHNLSTRVILITGYGNPDVMNKSFELGADFYYEKPVKKETLRQALESLGVPE